METQQDTQTNEIDLNYYINVVIKWKKLILSIFLVAVIVTAVVSLLTPKVYVVTSTIQLGSFNEPIFKGEDVKEIVLNYGLLSSIINESNLNIDSERLRGTIKIKDIGSTNLTRISIEYSDVDAGVKIINTILSHIISQGQSIYQERQNIANERLKELDAEIKNVEGDIARTQSIISDPISTTGSSQSDISLRIILLQNALPTYESNLTALRNQRNALKFLIANAKEFKIFDQPIQLKNPISPKKRQDVLIAGVISLLCGAFLAFFMEFLQKHTAGRAK
ncbi:MAG: Wzz/FepE/Etk N-terminal domain-containing protein [Candidatus Omnitrophica bacterium]|nr:Wzz/FepE/Etk N-terminal domain-containing protein [Candidatus Omnitrophota bacterium]